MLATKKYNRTEVIKNMKTVRECFSSAEISDKLQKRYEIWKEIVNQNKGIAKQIVSKIDE